MKGLYSRIFFSVIEKSINKNNRSTFILGLILFAQLAGGVAVAQESMSQEISAAYLDRLVTVAKARYPRVKFYQETVNKAGLAVKQAQLSYFDIISLSYLIRPPQSTAVVNPMFFNSYQFGLFVNVGSILQKPYVIKQARNDLKLAEYDQETYLLTLEAEVKKRYYLYIQQRTLFRIQSAALLDVESMLKDIRYKFENGTETLDNYNRVLIMQSNQMQEKVLAEGDMLIALSSLEELLGQKLSSIR
jgi:outer membrane protein TolC